MVVRYMSPVIKEVNTREELKRAEDTQMTLYVITRHLMVIRAPSTQVSNEMDVLCNLVIYSYGFIMHV